MARARSLSSTAADAATSVTPGVMTVVPAGQDAPPAPDRMPLERPGAGRSGKGEQIAGFKEVVGRMRQERELAAALAREWRLESVESEQGRLLVDMLRTFLSQLIRSRLEKNEADFDSKELALIAKIIKDLSQTMRIEQDYERRIRAEAATEAREAAARAAASAGRKRGLGAESIAAIKNRILGVRGDNNE